MRDMSTQEIKEMFSREVIGLSNMSYPTMRIVRKIIFDNADAIDWKSYLNYIVDCMPELILKYDL